FKNDTHDRTPLDINKVIMEVLALVRVDLREHHIILQTRLNERLPAVAGDRIQLQQVMLNLFMNAMESMDSVKDRARLLRVRSDWNGSKEVLVSIEDTGAGIEPNDVNRVFEPLFTTKSRGMGIGLSICRSIIEAHSGR